MKEGLLDPMENANTYIGMAFDADVIRFLEVERAPMLGLISAGEIALKPAFDFSTLGQPGHIGATAAAIETMVDRFNIAARQVAIALDHSMVLLKRLRIDAGLNEQELYQHIEWEMEQYLVAPRDEYHVSYERLHRDSDRFEYLVVAAVRKSLVEHLRSVFAKTRLTLQQVDVDVLLALRGLKTVTSDMTSGLAAAIQIRNNRLLLTLIKNGAFLNLQTIPLRPEHDLATANSERAKEVAAYINDELLRLMDALGDEVLLKTVEQVYITHRSFSSPVIAALQQQLRTAEVVLVDPLHKIQHALNVDAERLLRDRAGQFLPLIGLFCN
jgi:Tfp pilus assembly PilM family ATPase